MQFTGERVVPGIPEIDELLQQHLARYYFAGQYCSGRRVLDAGCGTGYGAALLAGSGARVTAVDRARDAIAFARSTYGSDDIAFLLADCTALPLAPRSFDAIVALEVIEHLDQPEDFLRTASHLLRPEGFLILSTPNAARTAEDEPNPYHVREYDEAAFLSSLKNVFPAVQLLSQRTSRAQIISSASPASHQPRPALLPSHRTTPATAADIPTTHAEFLIAICAQQTSALPCTQPFYHTFPPETQTLPAYAKHLESELAQKLQHILQLEHEQRRLTDAVTGKQHRIDALESAASQLEQLVRDQQGHALRLQEWSHQLQTELARRDAHLQTVAQYKEHLEELLARKDAHASSLEQWCQDLLTNLRAHEDAIHHMEDRQQELESLLLVAQATVSWSNSFRRILHRRRPRPFPPSAPPRRRHQSDETSADPGSPAPIQDP